MVNAMPQPLSYAAIEVPTHHRRTVLSTGLRWLKAMFIALAWVCRQLIVAVAFTLIAAGHVLRFSLQLIGAALLLLAGVRWSEIRRRMMRGALWVDRSVLRVIGVLARNPFARRAVR